MHSATTVAACSAPVCGRLLRTGPPKCSAAFSPPRRALWSTRVRHGGRVVLACAGFVPCACSAGAARRRGWRERTRTRFPPLPPSAENAAPASAPTSAVSFLLVARVLRAPRPLRLLASCPLLHPPHLLSIHPSISTPTADQGRAARHRAARRSGARRVGAPAARIARAEPLGAVGVDAQRPRPVCGARLVVSVAVREWEAGSLSLARA